MNNYKEIVCERCQEKINIVIKEKALQEWREYRGDPVLWKRYSHIQILQNGAWSKPYLIESIYRYDGGININHDTDKGSWCHIGMRKTDESHIYEDFRGTKYKVKLLLRREQNKYHNE